jgi:hypothetical protein
MLGNGTMRTVEDETDIYISLSQLCEYFTKSAIDMGEQILSVPPEVERYSAGLVDMMATIADEFIELGKFEAQRRMIDNPSDLFKIIDKGKVDGVE